LATCTWTIDVGIVGKALDVQKVVNNFFRNSGQHGIPAYEIYEMRDSKYDRSNGWFKVDFATPVGIGVFRNKCAQTIALKRDLSLVKRQTLWESRQDIAGSQKRVSKPHYGVIKLPVWATRLPDNQH
jgi:hypothetical protein